MFLHRNTQLSISADSSADATLVPAQAALHNAATLRSLFLGGNLHLNIVWATRLLSAICRFHLSKGRLPVWTLASGTASKSLRTWMKDKGFAEHGHRPWVWSHSGAEVVVDLSPLPQRESLKNVIGAASYACRQGWRAWIFGKWLSSGRHDVSALPPLSASTFRALRVDDVRSWICSSAPAAAVALGAIFAGNWSRVAESGHSPLCPSGCGGCRPAHAPPNRPAL